MLVGRVSQAQKVCVEYGDGAADTTRSASFAVRFSPPDPTREAPFTIVAAGLEPGERVNVSISPIGIELQPAAVLADPAGEARLDFRVPSGASPDWVVVVTRASGERTAVAIPLPAAGADPVGRVTTPPFAPPTPDPAVTTSTCAPSPSPAGTAVRCTFVGLIGAYASFTRTAVRTGEAIELRFVDVVRPDGRSIYVHTYRVDPGDWEITARTPAGSTATARFTVTAD